MSAGSQASGPTYAQLSSAEASLNIISLYIIFLIKGSSRSSCLGIDWIDFAAFSLETQKFLTVEELLAIHPFVVSMVFRLWCRRGIEVPFH